jgi:hypothetical protein
LELTFAYIDKYSDYNYIVSKYFSDNNQQTKMKRLVLISSYCNTEEKIQALKTNLKIIKSRGLDVMLNSPISLPSDVIDMCDFYMQTKENPLLDWPRKSVMSWVKYINADKEIKIKRSLVDYGWAALYQTKKLSEYALTYDYDRYYHIIYDTIIDDTVLSTLFSDKRCSFFPFHEHNVSLHLIALDRENLLNFSNHITLESYIKFNSIVENWLYNVIINSNLNYTIESEKVDDSILFHKELNIFNYSEIDGLTFFISKDVSENKDINLFFYNNEEKINVLITIDGIETNYTIYNTDIINLGFKPSDIKNVSIFYNGISSDITETIKKITLNTIEVNSK